MESTIRIKVARRETSGMLSLSNFKIASKVKTQLTAIVMDKDKGRDGDNVMNDEITDARIIIATNNDDDEISDKVPATHLHCHFTEFTL